MDASFMIDNASLEHDSKFVAETLIAIFGKDFIEQVREIIISPVGLPKYKKFYIFTITNDHPAFMRLLNLIVDWKCAVIVYNIELNPTTMEYVKHYWKIISAPVWKTFTPYLMSQSEMSEIMPEPWAPEADAAFGPVKTYTEIDTDEEDDCKETIVLPPPMVRDNGELGEPCKLERSHSTQSTDTTEVNDDAYWIDYWAKQGPPKLTRS